jgi:hypothetical protein
MSELIYRVSVAVTQQLVLELLVRATLLKRSKRPLKPLPLPTLMCRERTSSPTMS